MRALSCDLPFGNCSRPSYKAACNALFAVVAGVSRLCIRGEESANLRNRRFLLHSAYNKSGSGLGNTVGADLPLDFNCACDFGGSLVFQKAAGL